MALAIGANLPDTFFKRLGLSPQKTALIRKKNGLWSNVSWAQLGERVFEIAWALGQQGIRKGDRVAILSQTRPEWLWADLAILSLGAVSVPIYAAITADDVFHILKDSGARGAFIEDGVQATKLGSLADRLPKLDFAVSFDKVSDEETLDLESWVARAASKLSARPEAELDWRAKAALIGANEMATLVYTSGTLGTPRGVELSHANVLALISDLARAMAIDERDTSLLFLPVTHIMGRIEQWMGIATGMVNAYAESYSTLIDNLVDIRPTVLVSVPRVFEKLYASIMNKFDSHNAGAGLVQQQSFRWALGVGRRYVKNCIKEGKKGGLVLRLEFEAADRMFFSKIREKLGGRLRFAIAGGAPMPPEITEFFHMCKIPLLEGYGLTETSGPATLNRPDDFRLGSVGKPLPSCEIKIATDGEILLRGKTLFLGYHGLPEQTRQCRQDGWFLTGDLGVLDADNFLRVTGRKKDVIVTAAGKNISPQKIENLIRADPLFSQVMVLGDGRNFLSALITLNPAEMRRRALELNLGTDDVGALLTNPDFESSISRRIEQINTRLASYETIKRYKILPRDFTVEAGELTPSLKIRRQFCSEKYAKIIDEFYKA